MKDDQIIQEIAVEAVRAMNQDSGYTPYLPDLRIRFSATSEEVMGGVRLAKGELIRMTAMLVTTYTNPYYQGDRPATGV